MARAYTLRRRAEAQAETRRRIVEAAVALHGSVGPARTTLSMVAERAGVQRHTLYAHFPDERSLFLACSALSVARDPLPDPDAWRAIADPGARLAAGLEALYAWYERNAALAACVLRDAEVHGLTREMVVLRIEPALRAAADVLGEGLAPMARALLPLAMGFAAWRALTEQGGLTRADAVRAMVRAVQAQGGTA
jgi:AcrR family transcriptional regulator